VIVSDVGLAVPFLAVSAARKGAAAEGLPGDACEVGGDDVGGVPVQAAAGPVVPDGGPRVRVRGGFLDIAQRHSGALERR
jgi:hypothetical protein